MKAELEIDSECSDSMICSTNNNNNNNIISANNNNKSNTQNNNNNINNNNNNSNNNNNNNSHGSGKKGNNANALTKGTIMVGSGIGVKENGQQQDNMEMDCGGCGESVRERTVLCVGGRTWHSRCLKCCACARPLHDQHSCFLRGMRLYCRQDYALTFGAKCAKCGRSVGSGDWVRRARERVYHLACFACDACSRQLSTGEQFALLDARLLYYLNKCVETFNCDD